MGNFALFVGCPSPGAAAREDRTRQYWDEDFLPVHNEGWGPALCAKYCVPMLWVACFESNNEIRVERKARGVRNEPIDLSFMGLWVDASVARARVLARKHGILSVVPAPLRASYGDLVDAWASHLETYYARGVFLDGDDVFGMIGADEAAKELRASLEALARMDRGEAPVLQTDVERLSLVPDFLSLAPDETPDAAALKWRVNFAGEAVHDSVAWPPQPTSAERAFADALPRVKPPWMEGLERRESALRRPWWKFWSGKL